MRNNNNKKSRILDIDIYIHQLSFMTLRWITDSNKELKKRRRRRRGRTPSQK